MASVTINRKQAWINKIASSRRILRPRPLAVEDNQVGFISSMMVRLFDKYHIADINNMHVTPKKILFSP